MSVRGYTFAIDWNADGDFSGGTEDLSGRVDKTDIEITVGRESQRTTAHAAPGRMGAVLHNHDRYLSPEYVLSPIYGSILPGRRAQFRATSGWSSSTGYVDTYVDAYGTVSGAEYTLIDGVLTTFKVETDGGANPFTAEVSDGYARLGAEKLSTQLYQGYRTGDAINTILDLIGWEGDRDIDPGATYMPYWWVEGDDPVTAINAIVDSEGPPSIAYIHGSVFHFHDRHQRLLNSRSTDSQATFTLIQPAGTGPSGDFKIESGTFDYDHGIDNITNSVTFPVGVRAAQRSSEVWSTDDAFFMAAGTSVSITAEASDPFFNASASVDTNGTVTATLDRDSGRAVTVTLTASGDQTISRIALVANSVPVVRTVQIKSEDAGSVARFGRQIWPDDTPAFITAYDAQAIADRIVAGYATNRPSVTFTVAGYNPATVDRILTLAISDRITVRNDLMGMNQDFIVERLRYVVHNMDLLELEIGASITDPEQPASAFQFDVSGHGFDQGSFGVSGIDNPNTMLLFDVAGQGFDDGLFAT